MTFFLDFIFMIPIFAQVKAIKSTERDLRWLHYPLLSDHVVPAYQTKCDKN